MSKFLEYFDVFGSFVGATFAWFFGSWDGLLKMLVALCFIDYCTGVIAAYFMHILSSSSGFRGIAKKITMFTLVGIAHIIDKNMLADSALLRNAVIFFYLANEGLSILENSIFIGIPIPRILKDRLLQLKNKDVHHSNDKNDKNE